MLKPSYAFYCLILLLAGCAKQGYPPGGPLDTAGPQAVMLFPNVESVLAPRDLRPWIRLNEYPQRTSIENAIFISPQPEHGFQTLTRGKRIEVRFNDLLPENQTIVITFGTKITDLYGNPMPAPITLAFSTGDQIDRAAVTGQIVGMADPSATWIWAYPLSSPLDTSIFYPDPRTNEAPYAAQPEINGHYRLSFLPAKRFRLFAIVDSRRNRLWDSDPEAIAFPTGDVLARVDTLPIVNFKLSTIDLRAPALKSAQTLHRQDLRLHFDEPVILANMRVTAQAQDGQILALINAYLNIEDSTTVIFTTAIQRPEDVYQIRADSVRDFAGNQRDSLVAEVTASTIVDTVGPQLVWHTPAEGDRNIDPRQPLQLGFSEAVIQTDLPRTVVLTDSADALVEGDWSFPSPALARFQPASDLTGGARYILQVGLDSLRDIFSNYSPDSALTIHFRTLDPQDFGSVSGRVLAPPTHLRVVIEPLGKPGPARETAVAQNGQWKAAELPTGLYHLWLYQDQDQNQRYSPGQLVPFTFAEPFVSFADTVRVRSRWDTENVELPWSNP